MCGSLRWREFAIGYRSTGVGGGGKLRNWGVVKIRPVPFKTQAFLLPLVNKVSNLRQRSVICQHRICLLSAGRRVVGGECWGGGLGATVSPWHRQVLPAVGGSRSGDMRF